MNFFKLVNCILTISTIYNHLETLYKDIYWKFETYQKFSDVQQATFMRQPQLWNGLPSGTVSEMLGCK